MFWLHFSWQALVEAVFPVACHICGHHDALPAPGPRVAGLRSCDRAPLCADCRRDLADTRPRRRVLDSGLPAIAGCRTSSKVLDLIAAWKYHGVRGMAWPLCELMAAGWPLARDAGGEVDCLVPIPLHHRRRRQRGFNQARLLAALLSQSRGVPLRCDLLHRCRYTRQQAALSSVGAARSTNVAGAFRAEAPSEQRQRLGLIDDVVTTGTTASAAAQALTDRGWRVQWILAVCLSPGAT